MAALLLSLATEAAWLESARRGQTAPWLRAWRTGLWQAELSLLALWVLSERGSWLPGCLAAASVALWAGAFSAWQQAVLGHSTGLVGSALAALALRVLAMLAARAAGWRLVWPPAQAAGASAFAHTGRATHFAQPAQFQLADALLATLALATLLREAEQLTAALGPRGAIDGLPLAALHATAPLLLVFLASPLWRATIVGIGPWVLVWCGGAEARQILPLTLAWSGCEVLFAAGARFARSKRLPPVVSVTS